MVKDEGKALSRLYGLLTLQKKVTQQFGESEKTLIILFSHGCPYLLCFIKIKNVLKKHPFQNIKYLKRVFFIRM